MLKNYSQILKIWEEKPLCLLKKSLWALLQSTLKEGLAFAKTVQKSCPSPIKQTIKPPLNKPYFGTRFPREQLHQ